jgi:hypothetical protein
MKKLIALIVSIISLAGISTSYADGLSFLSKVSWQHYQENVLAHQPKIPGWCPLEKARQMMNLIYETKPQVCVEVGVFGGSSIYPTACAVDFNDLGQVYAIDPWSNSECLEGYAPDDPNYQWWNKIDLEKIYRDFLKMLHHFKLDNRCTVMRMTGNEAIKQFDNESIDILHIDGNHTESVALNDAKTYLPKVKKGGYIWFDDINWPTTRLAIEYLQEHCVLDETRTTNAYALFQKK